MDVTAMIPPAKPAVGPMSLAYLVLASLLAWASLAAQTHAADDVRIVIGEPQATIDPGTRTVSLQVVVQAPVDGPKLKRLTYLWTSNIPVSFSSANGTTRGHTLVATLSKVGDYRFSVLVQDPLTYETVTRTSAVVPIPVVSTSVRVVEAESQSSFASVFSPDAGSNSLVFQGTILDQFGADVAANVFDRENNQLSSTATTAAFWTLSWGMGMNESDVDNPSFSSISDLGLFSVSNGEGVHSYTILATMTPSDPLAAAITGTATAQTNQVRILFKPEQATGVPGYLYDHGTQRTAATGTTIQWGWNIPGIDAEAMRSREHSPISTDQAGRCFALMQMKTYLRVVASTDPDHPTDPAEVGMLDRDINGDVQVDQDLSTATWTLWNLPAGSYTLQVRAGDPVSYGRTVDLVLTSGAITTRVTGSTTQASPWITDLTSISLPSAVPLVLSSGPLAQRNLINAITIKKTIPN